MQTEVWKAPAHRESITRQQPLISWGEALAPSRGQCLSVNQWSPDAAAAASSIGSTGFFQTV